MSAKNEKIPKMKLKKKDKIKKKMKREIVLQKKGRTLELPKELQFFLVQIVTVF
jgi:hypothetical protein